MSASEAKAHADQMRGWGATAQMRAGEGDQDLWYDALGAADFLDDLASTLAHVDPAVLDLAAVVAADVAEAPLPDGWTAAVVDARLVVVLRDVIVQVYAGRRGHNWTTAMNDHAHLADVVAAVTGATS